ncbi:Hypothetical predicted protein [Olea europaea subsp. europaea]|uniref:Prolamin-like domain-containing protein n=1 Tax=Olea europaea subsp. europaea TaxID=158383 RepID=A0A8S0S4Y9_OLEEU|nr:Hypothetical predicted protein [Olea europaea subsp. europaea]
MVMATSVVSRPSYVAEAPQPQLSAVGALTEAVQKMEGFLPCLESLKASVVSRPSYVADTPPPQLSAVGALTEAVQKMEGFLPCLESLKGLEACTVNIFKAVFGLPLDTLCCQAVNQIAKSCLGEGFPLSQVYLPVAVENCIRAPEPPTSI